VIAVAHRYARLSRFKPIGEGGVRLLRTKKAVIVGVGALGTVQAEMLVRSGIGEVTLIDRDYVDLTNLQRQTLFTEADVLEQMPKAEAAKRRLAAINKDVTVNAVITDLNAANAEELLTGYDVILDGTDNFETRLILNDLSVKLKIPWIYGAATGSYGLTYTFIPEVSACFNCLYRYFPVGGETCETAGIIGSAAQLVASLQCAEALKWLTDNQSSIRKGLLYFDLWSNDFSTISLDGIQDSGCPTCRQHQYPHLQGESGSRLAVLCGRNTVQIRPPQGTVFHYEDSAKRLKESGIDVKSNEFLTQLKLPNYRIVIFKDGRALIHGTNRADEAKRLYQKYIGG